MRKILIVHGLGIEVLSDYISSLNIVHKLIPITEFDIQRFLESTDVYVFTQLWLDLKKFPESIYKSERFLFLNVEMLTESKRLNQVIQLAQHKVRLIDYSISNIDILMKHIAANGIQYPHEVLWLPYQYNVKEVSKFSNPVYKYDIGIINAFPAKDASVNPDLTYRRGELFEKLAERRFNCLNILGWGDERDELIKECRIIINVHHFECFNIFEHIRCDRLIFADQIIISDKSYLMENLDIFSFVIWKDYEDIVDCASFILRDFNNYKKKLTSLRTMKRDLIADRALRLQRSYLSIVAD